MIGGMLDTLGRRRRNKDQEMDKLLVVMPPRERMAFGILLLFVFAAGVLGVVRQCHTHRFVRLYTPPDGAGPVLAGHCARPAGRRA